MAFLLFLSTGVFAAAQTAPQSLEAVLHRMSDNAAIIFVGQVIAIRPHVEQGSSSGYVEVEFQINRPIRGCNSGTYILREWSGLWQGNANRYRVGQHLLMFLHTPSPSEMTSPVDDMNGAVPLRAGGAESSSSQADAQNEIADLRWLGAEVERSSGFTLHAPLSPAPLTLAQQLSPASAAEPISTIADTSRASVPVQQASVDTVMKLLLSWRKASSNAIH